jgi:hypothetical protein
MPRESGYVCAELFVHLSLPRLKSESEHYFWQVRELLVTSVCLCLGSILKRKREMARYWKRKQFYFEGDRLRGRVH